MKWKRMGTWNSDIGFNYDDLFPCTVGIDLFAEATKRAVA